VSSGRTRSGKPFGVQADVAGTSWTSVLKRAKARRERRRAKRDPECVPGYGRYVSTLLSDYN
jgi:hypothetical protein